jgi:hypothetical protein
VLLIADSCFAGDLLQKTRSGERGWLDGAAVENALRAEGHVVLGDDGVACVACDQFFHLKSSFGLV